MANKKKIKGVEPVNIATEKAILGCILKNKDVADNAIPKLTADMFYDNNHKSIFTACQKLYEEGKDIDVVTAQTQMINDRTDFPDVFNYLVELTTKAPIDITKWESYVDILMYNAKLQQIINAGSALIEIGRSAKSIDEASERVSDVFIEISDVESSDEGIQQIDKLVLKYIDNYHKALNDKNAFKGLSTGFNIFDEYTNGLLKSAVHILAARPGVGKTAFALNIVANIIQREAQKNIPLKDKSVIAFFCLEMSNDDLIHRLMSTLSNIPLRKIRKAEVSNDELFKFAEVSQLLQNNNLYLDTTASISPGEILARCQKIKIDNGGRLDLVVIDYLQLLSLNESGAGSGNMTQDVTRISRGIKMLAMKLNVPVIALSQMSRSIDSLARKDKTPKLSDLRESGAIEQDADVVFFLSYGRKADSEKGLPATINLNIEKNRHGERNAIVYNWYGSTVTFKEAPVEQQRVYDTESGEVKGKGKYRKKEESDSEDENKIDNEVKNENKENDDSLGY
ncbi:MAG TPA: replicative DNA helicase [Clostridiales bacterium]|nr:replicative DNA helicase [Clostridiales bacterium]